MDRNRAVLALVALAAFALLPFAAGPFWMGLTTQMLIFGLLALSTDLLLGHAGLFSLCHASFFAVSAFFVYRSFYNMRIEGAAAETSPRTSEARAG